MIPALLLMSTMTQADAAKPPERPQALAEITVTSSDDSAEWVLTLHHRFKRRGIGPGPHLEQPSTALRPDLERGRGEVLWLVGHHLRAINDPGDVTWSVSLLVELPDDDAGPVKALWHHDHMTVPTDLYLGAGTLGQAPAGAAGLLSVDVQHVEHGDALHIEGLLKR
jgi:hypothetical protein